MRTFNFNIHIFTQPLHFNFIYGWIIKNPPIILVDFSGEDGTRTHVHDELTQGHLRV